jgi:excisionase family DNA binding protein
MNNKFYTPTEISEMLKVSKASVWRWIREGKLKAHQIGHSTYRISDKELSDFLNKRKTK